MKQIIQRIPMNVRRMNIFFFFDRCNAMHTFYSFARLYHLSSRNHFCHRTRRVLRAQHLITSCPIPTANRGRHGRSADHYYTSSPTPTATEAAARAQRRLLYKQCPRRVPLRGRRSETKGSAPQWAAARRRTVGEHQAPPAAGVPVEGAGVPVVVDVVGEGAAGTGVPAGVPVEGGAGTGVPGGVTAEPAAEVPVEGTGVPAGVPVEGGAGTGVPGGVTAEPAAEEPVEGAGVPVVVDVVGEGAAGTVEPAAEEPVEGAGVPVEGGAGTGVPGGVTAEPAAEEPVEGAGAPGVAPPVGEPPCCALAPCFFLSRCTKLTA